MAGASFCPAQSLLSEWPPWHKNTRALYGSGEVIVGYRLLRYVCIRNESEGENTTAQVPTSLNGCSGMKGGGERREGKMAGQVCVTGGRGGRRWWGGTKTLYSSFGIRSFITVPLFLPQPV